MSIIHISENLSQHRKLSVRGVHKERYDRSFLWNNPQITLNTADNSETLTFGFSTELIFVFFSSVTARVKKKKTSIPGSTWWKSKNRKQLNAFYLKLWNFLWFDALSICFSNENSSRVGWNMTKQKRMKVFVEEVGGLFKKYHIHEVHPWIQA